MPVQNAYEAYTDCVSSHLQCVGGTLTDAFSNGYDCVLLGDGCGTTTPEYAQQCWEVLEYILDVFSLVITPRKGAFVRTAGARFAVGNMLRVVSSNVRDS